jgi:hypothetical protein
MAERDEGLFSSKQLTSGGSGGEGMEREKGLVLCKAGGVQIRVVRAAMGGREGRGGQQRRSTTPVGSHGPATSPACVT